jgi:hypothetical protein
MPKALIAFKTFIAFIVCGVLLTIVWLFFPRPESVRPASDSNAQQPPSEPAKPVKPQPLSAAEKRKGMENLLASKLQGEAQEAGLDMTIFRGPEESGDELVIYSEIFEHDEGRVGFIQQVLPKWRHGLCDAGYRLILLKSGTFSVGSERHIGRR